MYIEYTLRIKLHPPIEFMHQCSAELFGYRKVDKNCTLFIPMKLGLVISVYLSSPPVAHLRDAPRRRLVVTGDSARIQS